MFQAYGDEAFEMITPLTFELPSQTFMWLEHIKDQVLAAKQEAAAAADAGHVTAGGGSLAASAASPAAQQHKHHKTSKHKSRRGQALWILKTAQNLGRWLMQWL